MPLASAGAHPVDELLQQVYVSPSLDRVAIDLELTPAAEIAKAFLAGVDTDGDGEISAAEAAAHAAAVGSAVSVTSDGKVVALQLDNSSYPTERLMLAAAGTIVLKFHATLPAAGSSGRRQLVVRNRYAPKSATGAINTTVQASVTSVQNAPLVVAAIERDNTGRMIRFIYRAGPPADPNGRVRLVQLLLIGGGTIAIGGFVGQALWRRRRVRSEQPEK